MKYAISDIHGCYEKFLELLKLINFNENDTLYILGDIIDRGKDPLKMLKYVLTHKNIIMLKGNHEEMMLKCFLSDDLSNNIIWEYNGGEITYEQFKKIPHKSQKEILKYLQNLPNYLIVDNKILVHAGIYAPKVLMHKTAEENMQEQYEDDLLWIRDDFLCTPTNFNEHIIIFGHTPTIYMQSINNQNSQIKIWHDPIFKDKIGIDCGCVFGGNLACLCLDTMEEYYV